MAATRWGIASVGKISNDFVLALSTLPTEDHTVVAAAGRDLARATEFAKNLNIPRAYGSYEELAQDPEVDVVYIGSINTEHLRLGTLFLEAGKPILCEKPLCMNAKEVKQLIEVAKRKKLFLMEAIWSRFNPIYLRLRDELAAGKIGTPYVLQADFGTVLRAPRVSERALGGSALLDIGVYCIQLAFFVFGRPTTVKAIGTKNSDGVDDSVQILMQFPEGKAAVLTIHAKVKLPNDARITGTDGSIVIKCPFWTPTELLVNGESYSIQLPKVFKPLNFTNSTALRFEAEEVRKCLQAGLLESPGISWEESCAIAELEDEVRRQIGEVFDQD